MSAPTRKTCPHCQHEGSIDEDFGYRNCRLPNGTVYVQPQSWCRKCRTAAWRTVKPQEAR